MNYPSTPLPDEFALLAKVGADDTAKMQPRLSQVFNLTGMVLLTNLVAELKVTQGAARAQPTCTIASAAGARGRFT